MDVWPFKDPNETLDYGFNWAAKRLEDGETIVTSTWAIADGTVTKAVSPIETSENGITKVWLQGGTLGETCIITNTVLTSVGRIREWSAKLKIKTK